MPLNQTTANQLLVHFNAAFDENTLINQEPDNAHYLSDILDEPDIDELKLVLKNTDTDSLDDKIIAFLKKRWECNIRNTSASYVNHAGSPLNQLCIKLAQAICQGSDLCYLDLLMPGQYQFSSLPDLKNLPPQCIFFRDERSPMDLRQALIQYHKILKTKNDNTFTYNEKARMSSYSIFKDNKQLGEAEFAEKINNNDFSTIKNLNMYDVIEREEDRIYAIIRKRLMIISDSNVDQARLLLFRMLAFKVPTSRWSDFIANIKPDLFKIFLNPALPEINFNTSTIAPVDTVSTIDKLFSYFIDNGPLENLYSTVLQYYKGERSQALFLRASVFCCLSAYYYLRELQPEETSGSGATINSVSRSIGSWFSSRVTTIVPDKAIKKEACEKLFEKLTNASTIDEVSTGFNDASTRNLKGLISPGRLHKLYRISNVAITQFINSRNVMNPATRLGSP